MWLTIVQNIKVIINATWKALVLIFLINFCNASSNYTSFHILIRNWVLPLTLSATSSRTPLCHWSPNGSSSGGSFSFFHLISLSKCSTALTTSLFNTLRLEILVSSFWLFPSVICSVLLFAYNAFPIALRRHWCIQCILKFISNWRSWPLSGFWGSLLWVICRSPWISSRGR